MSCLLLGMTPCYALVKNEKMGKPTQEELTLTQYEPDPEAKAVVLYSSTRVHYDIRGGDFKLVSHFKKRIKVLSEDGKGQGDVEVVIYDNEENNSRDSFSGLKGTTFNIENGSTTKAKLSSDLKSEQRLDPYHMVKKFSLPNVRVGSVLEYEYEITSDNIYDIDTWYAQEDIPVFYTEYDVTVPEWFIFRTNQTGFYPLNGKREAENYIQSYAGDVLTGTATHEHFEGNQLPRLKDDEYVYCIRDFCTKVAKEFTNFIVPGRTFQSFNQDWKHEIEDMMKSSYFGKLCDGNNPVSKETIRAIQWPEDFTVKEKVDSLRNLLWQNYSWNESYNLYGRNIRNLNKEKSGNSATMNFALLNMLNAAGIEAYPVVFSRRTKGRLPITPSKSHLNAMTLGVFNPADSTYFYVDAGSTRYPVGSIPSNFLVEQAFRIDPETNRFKSVDLSGVSKGSELSSITATIDNEGLMSGTRTINHRGLESAWFRNHYNEAEQEEVVQKLASNNDVEIEDYKVENVKNTKEGVNESYSFSKQLDIEGDHIYVNPFLFLNFDSPFKAEKRDLPIEFGSNLVRKHNITFELPDNYEVEEMPKPIQLKMPDGKLMIRIVCNKVSIAYNYTRNTLFYATSDYELIRNFYTAIEQSGNAKLVLKKKS